MKKLAIIIGHSDNLEGARMCEPFEHVHEYEYNTLLAGLVKMYSLDLGGSFQVKIFLRDGKGIVKTYEEVEKWGAQASIELHFNGLAGKASGSMVLYGSVPTSNMLAHLCQKNIQEVIGNKDHGTKFVSGTNPGAVNLTGGEVPKVIIEPFFGTDLDDAKRGLQNIHPLAKAILKSGVEFMYM